MLGSSLTTPPGMTLIRVTLHCLWRVRWHCTTHCAGCHNYQNKASTVRTALRGSAASAQAVESARGPAVRSASLARVTASLRRSERAVWTELEPIRAAVEVLVID